MTNERYIANADKILRQVEAGKIVLYAPDLAKCEVANALLKGKQLEEDEARIALHTLYNFPITFVTENEKTAKRSFAIAKQFDITYYDAVFVVLADMMHATLVTENIKHQGKVAQNNVVALRDY